MNFMVYCFVENIHPIVQKILLRLLSDCHDLISGGR